MRAATTSLSAVALLLHVALARAQPASEDPAATPQGSAAPPETDPRLGRAKDLFARGNALRRAGDCERALEYYRESRAVVPSMQNTVNAAYCADALGRNDEALELYEAALAEFESQLDASYQKSLAPKLADLRARVGYLDITATSSARLLVDGRERSSLPLKVSLRLMPGVRLVRVFKEGYATFEQRVSIAAARTTSLDVRLEPLVGVGRLRVEGDPAATLWIDGARLGTLPWEGMLAPGAHLYAVEQGDAGTGPERVVVLQGQTALVRPSLRPLGGMMQLVPDPADAELALGDTLLGSGAWHGRLPVGRVVIHAREAGYHAARAELDVRADSGGAVPIHLTVDDSHPRWGASRGIVRIEVLGGFAISPTLGSGAESSCDAGGCSERSLGTGVLVAARGGYELPMHVALEIAGGWTRLQSRVRRAAVGDFLGAPVTWDYADEITLRGPFATAGASYRLGLGEAISLSGRAHAGILFASSRDDVNATLSSGGETSAGLVENDGAASHSTLPIVLPELRVAYRLHHVLLGAGIGALFALQPGGVGANGGASAAGNPDCQLGPPPLACAQDDATTVGERSHGAFVAVVPAISFGYQP